MQKDTLKKLESLKDQKFVNCIEILFWICKTMDFKVIFRAFGKNVHSVICVQKVVYDDI